MDKLTVLNAVSGAKNQFIFLPSIKLTGFVLENGFRIITKESVHQGLGSGSTDKNWLYEYLLYLNKYRPIDLALLDDVKTDILFTTSTDKTPNRGIKSQTLVEACKTIIRFKDEGFLFVSELKIAKAAEEIVKSFSSDYNALIDFSSGFDLYKFNHKSALSRAIDNAPLYYRWTVTFPDSFYNAIFKLKNWHWPDLKMIDAAQFVHLITFSRLSDSLLQELGKSRPKIKHKKDNRFQQYIEHPEVQVLTQAIILYAKATGNHEQAFLQMLNDAYPILNTYAIETAKIKESTTIEAQYPKLSTALDKILSASKPIQ